MKSLARNTSQILICNSLRQNEHFSEAHSANVRSVRAQSSTLAAGPRAIWFLDAVQPLRDCALPTRFAPRK